MTFKGSLTCLGVLASLLIGGPASAQIENKLIKIGVLTDMAGFSSDSSGKGSVIAAQMAIEDFGGMLEGVDIKLVSADHQNKADVGASVAKRWIETENVNLIIDLPISSVALAVNEVVRNSPKAMMIVNAGGTADLTGEKCSPRTVHWTFDTWALANGTARAVLDAGGKSWFFLTADYAFGHALQRDASDVIERMGGKVMGGVRHPTGISDFSSYLLQAQASKAQVIGLANSSNDTAGAIKQAAEFQMTKSGQQRLAALLMMLSEVHAVGLAAAQGTYLTEAFYWDMNEGTRAFAKRFMQRTKGVPPTMLQAGAYASLLHYFKAVKAANSNDGSIVATEMKRIPTDDPLFGKGTVRADGRKIHDMHLFQVKSPAESKHPWDYYKLVRTIPGDEAFRPLNRGGCPLVTSN